MLAVLRDCGALAQLMPEVDVLYAPGPRARRSQANPGACLSRALDHAGKRGLALPVRYAVLAHDFADSALRPRDGAPSAQAMRGVRRAEAMSARLKVPVECRDAARLAARWLRIVALAPALQPAALLGVINAADGLRRPERLETLLHACECVVLSAPNAPGDFPPARYLLSALAVAKGVAAGAIARTTAATPGLPASARADAIAKAIRSARLKALRAWKRTGAQRGQARAHKS
jgi:tRNA nucleotidyltransferase (CCA-adding enzyme)